MLSLFIKDCLDQIPRPFDDEDEEDFDSDEEDAYHLEDVSSDVEISADEFDDDELEDDSQYVILFILYTRKFIPLQPVRGDP